MVSEGLKVKGELNIETFAFAFPNHLLPTKGTREEFTHIVPVDRDVKDTVIVCKHICCAVSNMDIPIENTNFLLVEFLLSHSRSNGHIVEEAKPSNIRAMSVMTRRPHNSKYRVYRLTRMRLT